jgi:signal transduction histidine kinase
VADNQTNRGAEGAAPCPRILAVEDNPRDVSLLRAHLAANADGWRCELRTAPTLAAACAALEGAPADVILLDLNLPDSSGWDTFESVLDAAPDAAVILLSGANHEELAAKAIKHGAQDYLGKDHLTDHTLRRAIRYAVERKTTELQLRRYRENLEDLVRSRTERIQETNDALRREVEERRRAEDELRRAMDLLREHDEARARFVSNVSHELKTPLASMLYAVENLLKGVVGPLGDACRSYITMLDEDCRRLARTVNDVLDLSRIESGTLMLHRVKLPFHRFVEHAVASLSMLAREKGLDVRVDVAGSKGFVDCDPHKMERVILNVVQNAIKFTPEGGTIDVGLRRGSAEAGGCMVLEVSDTGIGIPEASLPKITERYFRAAEKMSGAGLGLAIAKEVVDRHGGRLDIRSPVPGRACGTRVSLALPEAASPRVAIAAGDEGVRGPASAALAAEGYEVAAPSDGEGAWAWMMAGEAPHALIMDFSPPGMDGVEFIARIKSEARWQQVPVIVAAPHDVDGARRELIDGFRLHTVPLPVRGAEVVRAVERATQDHAHSEM